MHRWVVLGVAGSKRTRGLMAAAALARVSVQLVEWRDWLAAPDRLAQALRVPCRFKIEPPGDDPQVHLALLHRGCESLGRPPCAAPESGELAAVDAWFAGFQWTMQQLAALLAAQPQASVVNAPDDIIAMTDKLHCQQRLREQGLVTAALLGPVQGYDHLVDLLDHHSLDRVFVKARYGSSAAGVVAYRRAAGRQQATTSAQLHADGLRLFNVKRVCSYQGLDDVRHVIDLVAAQGAYVEAWLPKPRCGTGHFDLRVVTFGARAAHRVARVSGKTLTNLHLDSVRADPAQLLSANDLGVMEAAAEQAARVFPRAAVIGFDLVVRQGTARVLEANAFGDLLPGLLWQGRDTYATALD
ncbi:STM4014 family protein [Acidovorax sp. NPDC077693]|uniref:STM4014 family protein n=1 Tax=unclassified Acidovorax TaxID=2684926 RepID=UPI0037CAB288